MGWNAKGELVYHVVRVPERLRRDLQLEPKSRLRVAGVFNGEPFRLAMNPDPGRGHFLLISKSLLQEVRRQSGDRVEMFFDVVDPNEVEVPAELERALSSDPNASKVWSSLTPGK